MAGSTFIIMICTMFTRYIAWLTNTSSIKKFFWTILNTLHKNLKIKLLNLKIIFFLNKFYLFKILITFLSFKTLGGWQDKHSVPKLIQFLHELLQG